MPRTTFCYVILAHQYSGTLALVRRIAELSPQARILVRFEDLGEFDAAALRAAGATLASTIRARWGAWTLTEAMLEALAVARVTTDADHVVVISGQDYPVRDLAAWEARVEASSADALLDPIVDHPRDWRYRWRMVDVPRPRRQGTYRVVRHLAWRLGTVTRPVLTISPRFADGDRRWLIGVPRPWARVPGDVRVTKCSQWMTLSARAVDSVLRRDASDPALRTFFRTVRISDESYIQTLVNDDPQLVVRHGETTVKRFTGGKSSPQWLDVESLRELAGSSSAPFARKVAPDADDVRRAADELADTDARADLGADLGAGGRRCR